MLKSFKELSTFYDICTLLYSSLILQSEKIAILLNFFQQIAAGSDCGKQKIFKNKIQTRLNFTKKPSWFFVHGTCISTLNEKNFLSGLHFKIYFVKITNNIVIQSNAFRSKHRFV